MRGEHDVGGGRVRRGPVTALVVAGVMMMLCTPGAAHAAGPPDAPTDVVAAAGDASALVSWSAPADNGQPIVEYRVYLDDGNGYRSVVGSPPATSLTVDGLSNGTDHTFRVSAVNAGGESPRSESAGSATPWGATSTTVTFVPPSPTYGEPFDVVATVTASSVVQSGNVTFYRGGTMLGSVAVVGGTATWRSESRPAGVQGYASNFMGTAGFGLSGGVANVVVAKAGQTITFTPPGDTAHAAGPLTLTPSSTSGLPVALAAATPSVCTVAAGTVTLVTGGTCTLVASQAGSTNYLAAQPVTRSFEVTAAPQHLTFPGPADRTWSPATFDLAPSSSSGLAPTLASSTPEVCTVAGLTVTSVRTGTCTLVAEQAGDAHFAAAPAVERSFEITPAGQGELTAGTDATALVIGDTTNVASSGGSGTGEVTFQVTTGPERCVLTGTLLTAVAAGTCVVTATKAADGRYAAASATTAVVTVSKAAPSVVVTGPATVQAGHNGSLTVAVDGLRSGLAPGEVTVALIGDTGGAWLTPSGAALTVAPDGRSGAATFTLTAGTVAVLEVHASLAGTAAYEPATATMPAGVTVVAVPPLLHTLTPTRVVDTRPGYAHVRPAPDRKLAAGEVLQVQLTDLPGLVPTSGVSAVALGVGVVAPEGDGYVTAYPCGERPVVSNVNFRAGQPVTNAAIVPVQAGTGTVCFYASRATHLVIDLDGWISAGDGFVDVPPVRVVDTRGNPALRTLAGAFAAGETRRVQFTDLPGRVPAEGVAAVSLNLTVVQPSMAGYLTAYPCGERPNASSINVAPGRAVANLAIVPVEPGSGDVCFYASQALHLVVDLSGWFEVGHGFTPSGPDRLFDTRPGFDGRVRVESRRLGPDEELAVTVTDLGGGMVPAAGVGAVSLDVAVVDPAGDGYVTVYACGTRPGTSNSTYLAHQTVANSVIAPVDPVTGRVCFTASQAVHLAVDLNGWFLSDLYDRTP